MRIESGDYQCIVADHFKTDTCFTAGGTSHEIICSAQTGTNFRSTSLPISSQAVGGLVTLEFDKRTNSWRNHARNNPIDEKVLSGQLWNLPTTTGCSTANSEAACSRLSVSSCLMCRLHRLWIFFWTRNRNNNIYCNSHGYGRDLTIILYQRSRLRYLITSMRQIGEAPRFIAIGPVCSFRSSPKSLGNNRFPNPLIEASKKTSRLSLEGNRKQTKSYPSQRV